MNSLFAQAKEAQEKATAGTHSNLVCKTTEVDVEQLEALADKIVSTYPGMTLNSAAIEKGGKTATGRAVVQFAVKRRLPTPGSVTIYHNGRAVWSGIEPLAL